MRGTLGSAPSPGEGRVSERCTELVRVSPSLPVALDGRIAGDRSILSIAGSICTRLGFLFLTGHGGISKVRPVRVGPLKVLTDRGAPTRRGGRGDQATNDGWRPRPVLDAAAGRVPQGPVDRVQAGPDHAGTDPGDGGRRL